MPHRRAERAGRATQACRARRARHTANRLVSNGDASGPRFAVLDLQGTLQAASGVPGAATGQPVLDAFAPPTLYQPDCLHPSSAGFAALFREMVDRWWRPQQLARVST